MSDNPRNENARNRETKNANQETEGRDRETEAPAGDGKPVRTPQVRAGACPKSELHTATRVYKTLGEVRYCVCDDCGHTWKKHGPPATPKPAKDRGAS
jgi:hypothetical protein